MTLPKNTAPAPDDKYPPAPEGPRAPTGRLDGLISNLDAGKRFSSPLARCIFIGLITLFLLYPLGLVNDVADDRI
jgi:hypothetical protein